MRFLEMKARIEKVMPEIFETYARPDDLLVFAGANDEKLPEDQRLIKSKPKAGARFVYNKADSDIKTVTVDPRASCEAYIDHNLNQIYLGGQMPIPKLLTTPGFTEVSANAAIEVAELHGVALQRFIKRMRAQSRGRHGYNRLHGHIKWNNSRNLLLQGLVCGNGAREL